MDAKQASTGVNEIDNRRQEMTDVERLLLEQIKALAAQIESVREELERVGKILEGNGNPGLFRLLEEMHRTIQLQNEFISALSNELNLEKLLSEAVAGVQFLKTAQALE